MVNFMKIGFIGFGNMAKSIVKGWEKAQNVELKNVYAYTRSPAKAQKFADEHGIQFLNSYDELVDKVEVLILAVKPQDIKDATDAIRSLVRPEHIVISMAAGIDFSSLGKALPTERLVRIMPNTPISLREAVVGVAVKNQEDSFIFDLVEDLFSPLGTCVTVEEGEAMHALTVGCGSGTGFVFELMEYWQDWLCQNDFEEEQAREMVVQTFKGATALAEEFPDMSFVELLGKVMSKKGVTEEGIRSMREQDVERGLRYSFQKAVMKDKSLSKLL